MMSRTSARAMKEVHAQQGAWNLPPEEKKLDRLEVKMGQNPTTGRNTRKGRKVEKPADPKAGGPSGQKDRARHDKRHANT